MSVCALVLFSGTMAAGATDGAELNGIVEGMPVPPIRPFEWVGLRGTTETMPLTARADADAGSSTPESETLNESEGFRLTGMMEAVGCVGTPFTWTAGVAGAVATFFAAQDLPDGLSLDASRGLITGVPARAGTYDVTLTAFNEANQTATGILRIHVAMLDVPPVAAANMNAVSDAPPPTLPDFSLPGGTYNGTIRVRVRCYNATMGVAYSVNGEDPSDFWMGYVGNDPNINDGANPNEWVIRIPATSTLKFCGYGVDKKAGPIKSVKYTIAYTPETPKQLHNGIESMEELTDRAGARKARNHYYFDVPETATSVSLALHDYVRYITGNSTADYLPISINVGEANTPRYPDLFDWGEDSWRNDYNVKLHNPWGRVKFSLDENAEQLKAMRGKRLYITAFGFSPMVVFGEADYEWAAHTYYGTYSLTAIAVNSGLPNTPVVIWPNGGTFLGRVDPRFTSGCEAMVYTTNGEDPATSSAQKELSALVNTIPITTSCTLKIRGRSYVYGDNGSVRVVHGPLTSARFTIISATDSFPLAPRFSLPGGTFPDARTVTITCAKAAAIRYTLDGSVPSASHGQTLIPGGSVKIERSSVLRAVGVNAHGHAGPPNMVRFSIGETPESSDGWRVAAVGDFNGDRKSDILYRHGTTGKTRIFFMNGKTVASQANTSKSVDATWRVAAAADFNGDGKDDILWRNAAGKTYVWFMNGATVLASSAYTTQSVGNGWTIQGTGRFNNDKYADILWRNAAGKTFIWFMNGKTVLAASAYTSKTVGNDWTIQGVGDFNKDGLDDILWRHANGKTYLWFMNGKNVLDTSAYTSKTVGPDWTVLGVGHFNNDKYADILWRNGVGKTYLWHMSNAQVAATSAHTSASVDNTWTFVRPGDFNGDGLGDLLWVHTLSQKPYVWLMNGANVQTASGYLSAQMTPEWRVVGYGDFDNNGHDDVLWRNGTGYTYIWFMNGATVLSTSGYTSKSVGADWTVVGVGNFDGQYGDDILWRHTNGKTYLWRMNGKTVLASSSYTSSFADYQWIVAGVGDFNGDGKDDILWRHADGRPYLWLMNGSTVQTSTFTSGTWDDTAKRNFMVVGIGDFNADGNDDILWRTSNGLLCVWYMTGSYVMGTHEYTGISPGLDWTVQSVADMDADGKADILWRNKAGKTYLWLMNGLSIKKEGYTGNQVGTDWQVMGVGRGGASYGTVFWRNASTHQSYVWLQNGLATVTAAATTKQVN